ncbi:hypothetical protein DFH09DRAFT_1159576 [Mycena vulgaris]|nr:hypothetical protein DFH09DRAFT_1159576 [Mycena vulgaris]
MPPKAPKTIKIKIKTYHRPKSLRYLFLRNPWPYHESVTNAQKGPQRYVNAVIGWLCCMIHDLCDVVNIEQSAVRIFYQGTHRDLIAEISTNNPNFSLEPLLGAHDSSAFLTSKYRGRDNLTSILYEYDYERCNSPEKTNWSDYRASYISLDPDFAIKHKSQTGHGYPNPSPTDAKKPERAKRLPGRLIIGHPDCMPQTLAPPANHSTRPASMVPPLSSPHGRPSESTRQQSNPAMTGVQAQSAASSERSPGSARRSPPPQEEPPSSQFAFTRYERPLNFPPGQASASVRSTSPPAAPQQQPDRPRIKRDPHEEEADALERLRDGHVAVGNGCGDGIGAPRQVKVKTEEGAIKRKEYQSTAEMLEMQWRVEAEMAARASAGERMDGAGARVKQEQDLEDGRVDMPVHVKVEQGVGVKTEPELVDLLARVQAGMRARNPGAGRPEVVKQEERPVKLEADVQNLPVPRVKPEPIDDHIPKPPPPNRCFDPFDRYGEVKKEEEIELNSRQAPSRSLDGYPSSSAYPRHPPPRVKQEEFASRPRPPPPPTYAYPPSAKQEPESGASGYTYAGRDSRTYSPAVKQEYGGDRGSRNKGTRDAPAPSSFPRQHSIPDHSRSSYSYSSSSSSGWRDGHPGGSGGYAPARHAGRTFSPSPHPHPVKREREGYDDHRPYDSHSREPPIKRERTEPHFSGAFDYTRNTNPGPPSGQTTRDPSMRAKLERDHEERDSQRGWGFVFFQKIHDLWTWISTALMILLKNLPTVQARANPKQGGMRQGGGKGSVCASWPNHAQNSAGWERRQSGEIEGMTRSWCNGELRWGRRGARRGRRRGTERMQRRRKA